MKIFFLLLFTGITAGVNAQQSFPSYGKIVHRFFAGYSGNEDYDNYTSFSKKRKGWYVQQVDRIKRDSLLEEHLFWDADKNIFTNLSSKYQSSSEEDRGKKEEAFLSNDIDVFNFNANKYYGYNDWDRDVISDFGSVANPDDSTLLSLSRAYKSYSGSYLWYQWGGTQKKGNPLQVPLGKGQLPNEARVKKVIEYLGKAVDYAEKLKNKNPLLITKVGNAELNYFSDCMNAVMQLQLCGRDDEAEKFMQRAVIPAPYLIQAKNYLNSCAPAAVLFTYGDNDTFQLWYLQEKENFRKDVTVINTGMLGMPIYIEMLKRKKIIKVNAPSAFYTGVSGDLSYYENNTKAVVPPMELNQLLTILYSKKYPKEIYLSTGHETAASYPVKKFYFSTPVKLPAAARITHDLSSYIVIYDLLMLDIIQTNIDRPIFFTSMPDNLNDKALLNAGINYRLSYDLKNLPAENKKQQEETERFAKQVYVPVLSNEKINTPDGDNTFVMLYYKIISYYSDSNRLAEAKSWFAKELSGITDETKFSSSSMNALALSALAAEDFFRAEKFFHRMYELRIKESFEPTGVEKYIGRNALAERLRSSISYFTAKGKNAETLEAQLHDLENRIKSE